jgi:LmbE family N-acetylglucosaminyl deacetylase
VGGFPKGRVVVVSPHSDDAVFSLATTIATAVRRGTRVEVLTVFGLDPASTAPANGWDKRGGFATEGDAARGRRDEDRGACDVIGATPMWLTFRGGGYTDERPTEAIWAAVQAEVNDADAVVVPGFPLTNPDHAWLSELLTTRALPCSRVGLYVEQPYRYMSRREASGPSSAELERRSGPRAEWVCSRTNIKGYRLKRKAIGAYASQLPLLGYAQRPWRIDRMLVHEAWHGGEAFAWLRPGPAHD